MNTKRKRLTDEHLDLYGLLEFGRSGAKRLDELASLMGISERKVRALIEDLTVNEKVVCNLQNGKGYFKPQTDDDYEAMIKLTAHRAHSLLRKKYALKRAYDKTRYDGNSLFV